MRFTYLPLHFASVVIGAVNILAFELARSPVRARDAKMLLVFTGRGAFVAGLPSATADFPDYDWHTKEAET